MNDEFPMTKEFLKPNDEGKSCELAGTIWSFVIRASFDIRHSDFVIFQSHRSRMRSAECGMKRQLTTDNNHERFEIRLAPVAAGHRLVSNKHELYDSDWNHRRLPA
jgi:hypothetical protein